jgi:phospholipid/cholesterol/gamma-HCH transport system substrate-binding protein
MKIDFRKHMHLLVGFFVVSAVIVLLMTVTLLLNIKGIFNPEYHLFTVFESGIGLSKGTAVMYKGVKVGSVAEINLSQSKREGTGANLVVLKLAVDTEFQKFITDSCVAYVTRDKNMVSDRVINIESTGWSSRILGNNDTLKDTTSQDIETLFSYASQLVVRTERLMNQLDSVFLRLNDTGTTVGAMFGSREMYDRALKDIKDVSRTLSEVSVVLNKAEKMEDEINRVLPGIMSNTDSTFKSMARLSGNLERTMDRVDRILVSTQGLVSKAEGIMSEGGQSLEEADDLINAVSDFWFIRGKLKKQNAKEFPMLSNDLGI